MKTLIWLKREYLGVFTLTLSLIVLIHTVFCSLPISDEDLDLWNANPAAGPPVSENPAPTPAAATICLAQIGRIMGSARKIFAAKSPRDAASHVCGLDSMLNEWLEKVPAHLRWSARPSTVPVCCKALTLCIWLSQEPCATRSALARAKCLFVHVLPVDSDSHPPRLYLTRHVTSTRISFPRYLQVSQLDSDCQPPTRETNLLFHSSNAARSSSHVLDLLRQRGKIRDAFMFAPMQAITSGLILLISVFAQGNKAGHLSSSALSDVKRCNNVLADMSKQ